MFQHVAAMQKAAACMISTVTIPVCPLILSSGQTIECHRSLRHTSLLCLRTIC